MNNNVFCDQSRLGRKIIIINIGSFTVNKKLLLNDFQIFHKLDCPTINVVCEIPKTLYGNDKTLLLGI